jgi:hypothetical protein
VRRFRSKEDFILFVDNELRLTKIVRSPYINTHSTEAKARIIYALIGPLALLCEYCHRYTTYDATPMVSWLLVCEMYRMYNRILYSIRENLTSQ